MSPEIFRRVFNRAIDPLRRKVNLMVSRAVLSSLKTQDGLQLLQLKMFADEVTDDAEHVQEFGFRSKPPVGSEGIALSVGGNREHVVVVATMNREVQKSLPELADGESIMFTNTGNYFHLKAADQKIKSIGKYEIESDGNIETTAPKYKFSNEENELISVLIEWIEQHIANKNITALGPQPLVPADITKLEAIKTKLETFKA